MKLLNDMLDSNAHELAAGNILVAGNDTPFDLIKELYERCDKYRTILKQMPTIIDCSDAPLMGKIFFCIDSKIPFLLYFIDYLLSL